MDDIEIVLLDKDFKRFRTLRDFHSLQWWERYFDLGEFELHFPHTETERYMDDIFNAQYIFRKDKETMGVVQYRNVNDGDIYCKGRFLEDLTNMRSIETTTMYSGTTEDICRTLMEQFFINPSDPSRTRNNIILGPYHGGLGTYTSSQRTGKTIYDTISELLIADDLWFKMKYDLPTQKIIFEVFQGVDRTNSQNINSWCIFSPERYNIISQKYEQTDDLKNFAYIAGGGDGAERVVVTINQINPGENRNELYVDARDLQQGTQTMPQYQQTLIDRGKVKLAEYGIHKSVDAEIDTMTMGNMVYAIGDKCSYFNPAIGLTAEGRITEMKEVIEAGSIKTSIILGKEKLDFVKKIKRSMVN